jgi:hypothetical protein
MKTKLWVATSVALLALTVTSGGAETVTVHGRVVDAEGKPVAGAEVASFWLADSGSTQPYQGAVSDGKGEFTEKVTLGGRGVALMAMDKERKSGGVAVAEPKASEPVVIKLGPTVRVHGEFFCKELNKRPSWTNVYMTWAATKDRVLQCSSRQAKFAFHLPVGAYKFWGYGTDITNSLQDLTLSADKRDVDLGTIDVPATVIAKHIGKPPPAWNVTDARGAKKDVRLEDFRGKWVLLEFWGYW